MVLTVLGVWEIFVWLGVAGKLGKPRPLRCPGVLESRHRYQGLGLKFEGCMHRLYRVI